MRIILFMLLAMTTCRPSFGDDSTTPYPTDSTAAINSLISQAKAKNLPEHWQWHALLHYYGSTPGSLQNAHTEIISPEFFLAKSGADDPAAELEATLRAFFSPVDEDPNKHAQCRFVARYIWLQKKLDWSIAKPPLVNCKKYKEWTQQGKIKSISLIFATGYLSNPASLYGHLLVKFNTSSDVVANELLDPSLSYGAMVPKNPNGAVYLYKGLFGGYQAGFSHDSFFQHNHNYAEIELRDLWEYRLALPADDVELIVAHGWELLGAKFNYYFLSNNCAYQVAELLHLAIPEPLLPGTPWAIPSMVLNKLATIKKDGSPLVASTRKIPSRQNRFYSKYATISHTQQKFIGDLVTDSSRLSGSEYRSLPTTDQIKTLEVLFDYYEYQAANAMSPEKYRQQKQSLVIERLKLPPQHTAWPITNEVPPHEGNSPFMLQLSGLENSSFGGAAELRMRPAYYDMLSLDAGKLPYSSLTMLDLKLIYSSGRLKFRSLDFLGIESLNPSRTNLPGDGSNAWSLRTGVEQNNLRCEECPVIFAEGGLGKAETLGKASIIYGMLEGRLQSNRNNSGTVAGAAHIGLVIDSFSTWKTRMSVGTRVYVNGAQSVEPIIRWENRYASNKSWDLGISLEHNAANEIKTSMSYYW